MSASGAGRHVGMNVVFVHHGQVVVLVVLLIRHALTACCVMIATSYWKGRVIGAHVQDRTEPDMAVAVFVLQPSPLSVVRPAVPPTSQAARACRPPPSKVADALDAEHRNRRCRPAASDVVVAVRWSPAAISQPCRRPVDAFLQDLAVLGLLVEHQLVGIDRLVVLSPAGSRCRAGGTCPPMPKVRDSSGRWALHGGRSICRSQRVEDAHEAPSWWRFRDPGALWSCDSKAHSASGVGRLTLLVRRCGR